MQCRASRKHEKTFQELKAQAEGDKRNIVQFPQRRKAALSSDELFGTEENALSTSEPLAGQPKLVLLPPERILQGAAFIGRHSDGRAAVASNQLARLTADQATNEGGVEVAVAAA